MEQIENSSDEAIFFMGENPCWVSHLVDDMWSADRVLRSEEDELVLRSSQVSEPRMEPIPWFLVMTIASSSIFKVEDKRKLLLREDISDDDDSNDSLNHTQILAAQK